MSEMTETFNGLFPPDNKTNEGESEYVLNGEGIENCVMKNLY